MAAYETYTEHSILEPSLLTPKLETTWRALHSRRQTDKEREEERNIAGADLVWEKSHTTNSLLLTYEVTFLYKLFCTNVFYKMLCP